MSSSEKTGNLHLSKWLGSDVPERLDFVADNVLIDSAITNHRSDEGIHVTTVEKNKWNEPYHIDTYMGNGASQRTVALTSSFEPSWGIIFPVNRVLGKTDFANTAHYNYFGFVSREGSTAGLDIDGRTLSVTLSSIPISGNEYKNYNENGVTYICILFR